MLLLLVVLLATQSQTKEAVKANVAEAEAEIRDAKAKVTEAEAELRDVKAKFTEAEAKVDEAKAKVRENSADEYWIKELQDREGTLKRREEALKTANETLKRREEFFFAVRKSFIGASGIRFVLFLIFSLFFSTFSVVFTT